MVAAVAAGIDAFLVLLMSAPGQGHSVAPSKKAQPLGGFLSGFIGWDGALSVQPLEGSEEHGEQ